MAKRIIISIVGFIIAILWLFIIVGRGVTIGHDFNRADNWRTYQQNKTITVGLDDTFVPMGFRNKEGQIVGYDVDLAREVFKQYGIKVKFQPIDWLMKETELRNGTIDLIWNGYSYTPERAKVVGFSKPYFANGQVLVSLRSNNILKSADMKGKVLGVQSSSTGATDLDANPKILKQYIKNHQPILYDTFMNSMNDLNAGRIQGVLIDRVYADYYISHLPNPSKYRIVESGFPVDQFAVGIRKSDITLQNKVNEAITKMRVDGQLAKLNQKWFGDTNIKK
ncbi:amino acid ABC transporter substrate-binding protein [Periweissella fabalis]|uniref:Amino acid ABC transporter substrate-binding protein n=1 Tax=Periweissella fabalis TaxID=1070421 RepID=A0A7X6N5S7_9LACO|nr:amino acid ABC transporter substrate-binding protein [Periweissella fabalis]MCM0598828.1 amino acid ABC transporter substrate-binding protein [Periweissella fabalis]NKZ24490.1 amino acid ABC transporter substrate-binding protein [Periweissella fabalis]